jgi:hypothetical protein
MRHRHILVAGLALAFGGGDAFSDDKPEDVSALETQVVEEFDRLASRLKKCGKARRGEYPQDSRSAEVYGDLERPIEYILLVKVPKDTYFSSDASYPSASIGGVKEIYVTYEDRNVGVWRPLWSRWGYFDPNAMNYADRMVFDVLRVDHDKWPRGGWDYTFELYLSWPERDGVDTGDNRREHLWTALQNMETVRKSIPKKCKKGG